MEKSYFTKTQIVKILKEKIIKRSRNKKQFDTDQFLYNFIVRNKKYLTDNRANKVT